MNLKKKINIATILPYKENYSLEKASAASLWVSEFYKKSKFRNNNYIYGNTVPGKYLTKNPQDAWYFDALVKDAQDIEFSGSKNLLINSSAEHMSTINISSGIVAIQSNDYREVEDHINCVDSAEELADQYNIRKLWFSGQLKFPAYNRFMAIGRI